MVSAIAGTVVLLIGIATTGTVVFATRAGLAVHMDAIETLHVIGATDDYIARQFQARSLSLALRGGMLGLMLAILTLASVAGLAGQFEGPLMPRMAVTPTLWAGLAALPLGVSVIATLTARLTVIKALRRMP
jgi:cell division transport system permease protein